MFKISCIVEGEGEVQALPVLLRRVITDIAPTFQYEICRPPIRLARNKFDRDDDFSRMVQLASNKITDQGAVIILLDADDDCPATKGPEILSRASSLRPDRVFRVIMANREFESWFLASATSLSGRKGMHADLSIPTPIEHIRDAKGWLKSNREGGRYAPTTDQAAFASVFDYCLAERNSDSFAKFMKDVRSIIPVTL